MCGIFGSPALTPTVKRMLPYLGLAMQERGHDAWGASDGNTIIKHVGPLVDTWHDEEATFNGWDKGIFHTRGASHGSAKELDNAHPFSYQRRDGSWVIGTHNGVITNHAALDTKYNRHCDVDSMHIWMNRAEAKPWTDLQGWGNLAWWENNPGGEQCLNLCRFNNDALKVALLKNGDYVYSSTMAAISMAAKMVGVAVEKYYNIEEHYQYWWEQNREGRLVLYKSEEKLPFAAASYTTSYRGGYAGVGDGYCAKCGHVKVDSKKMIVCYGCLGELITLFMNYEDTQRAAVMVVGAPVD